jgi:Zn-dependent protease with chaperone function
MRAWVILGVMLTAGAATAAPPGRDAAREAVVLAKLKQQAPRAVAPFRRATAALDEQRTEEAIAAYREVLELAPSFAPALRRLSYVVTDPAEALRLARRARIVDGSSDNIEAVIRALLRQRDPATRFEANTLAAQLFDRAPTDGLSYMVIAQAAAAGSDKQLLRQAVAQLQRLEPQNMVTHYFASISAAGDQRWDAAEASLLKARQLGLPAADADRLLGAIRARGQSPRGPVVSSGGGDGAGWLMITLYAAIVWACGLVALLLVGLILSWLTLSTVNRASPEATGEPSGAMRTMRRVYGVVLALTSIYFYISIPFVLLLVLGAGGGLIYLFFALGRIPVKLVAVIAILVVVTLWAMLKSLFMRRKDEDPGELLPAERAPRLFAALREVAAQVGTRPVDAVYLVPDTAIAVYERGSFLKRMTGRTQRVLILGLGVLEGMSQTQLKAILAHEYGHFSNKDTAGGGLALHVRRAILGSAETMARGGAAAWYNPAWLFLNGFYRIYLRVSQGASRLQEVLADRWAALCYGARAFVDGLRHVVRRSIEFDLLANREIDQAIQAQRPLRNLYALHTASSGAGQLQAVADAVAAQAGEAREGSAPEEVPSEAIDQATQAALEEKASAYDSHPAPSQRIAWVERLQNAPQVADDGAPAWDLLDDRDALQAQMTELVNGRVQLAVAMQGLPQG